MSYNLSRYDIRFLDYMYKIGNVLSIVPAYSFDKCVLIAPHLTKLYAYIFLILEILGTTWIIYIRRFSSDISFFTITFRLLGTCDNLILTVFKISLILGICCFKQQSWLKLNNKFQFIDKELHNRGRKESRLLQNVYIQFFLCNLIFFSSVVFTIVVRILEKGFSTLKMFVIHEVSGYYNFYVHVLIWNIALAFRARYKCVNEQIDKILCTARKEYPVQLLKEIEKMSTLLGEMVALFNDIFGLPMVFMTGRCVIKTLVALNFFTSTLHIDNPTLRNRLTISSIGQSVVPLVLIGILILCCDSAKSESQKTVLLCYKLRQKYSDQPEIQKEVLELAHVIDKHRAIFTAGGFFEVNRSALFGILGTTTTYLIVTIQFNQSLKYV
ncbi:putative gustatory receptor 28a [Zophobas morio]|uniref:putative gustatory receptor 28a n=1 Tax=Zophobas morio TaxID=2755281 RepID=UPI0030833871